MNDFFERKEFHLTNLFKGKTIHKVITRGWKSPITEPYIFLKFTDGSIAMLTASIVKYEDNAPSTIERGELGGIDDIIDFVPHLTMEELIIPKGKFCNNCPAKIYDGGFYCIFYKAPLSEGVAGPEKCLSCIRRDEQ